MNQQTLQGKWNQLKGSVREQWGKLTDDDMDKDQVNYVQLFGVIQERYGYARDRAEREVDSWMRTQN